LRLQFEAPFKAGWQATLTCQNVKAPPDPRSLPLTVTDVLFIVAAALAFVGVVLLICWRPA